MIELKNKDLFWLTISEILVCYQGALLALSL